MPIPLNIYSLVGPIPGILRNLIGYKNVIID